MLAYNMFIVKLTISVKKTSLSKNIKYISSFYLDNKLDMDINPTGIYLQLQHK